MTLRWLRGVPQLAASVSSMLKLAWQTQPVIFILLVLLSGLQGVVPLGIAWLTKMLFDLLAIGLQGGLTPDLIHNLILILAGQAVLMLMNQMFGPANRYLNAEMGRKLRAAVQADVYNEISRFVGIAYFEDPEFHDTFRLASQGAQLGPSQSLVTLINLFQSILTLMGFIAILIAFSPLLGGLVGLAALPQLYAQLKIGRQRYALAFDQSPDERRIFYYGYILSSLQTAKEIRLFGLADYFLDSLLGTFKKVHLAKRRQDMHELRWSLLLKVLSTVISSSVFVVVVLQAFAGHLSLGDITLYTSAVRSVQGALSGIVLGLSDLIERTLFFTHYQNLKALPQPVRVADQPRRIPELVSGIELREVSFRYTEKHPWALRDVNLFIPAGRCLALVGLNGAGKTTLVKLLTRLYDPTEGKILWDEVDIREFAPEDLRRRMGVIFQDFMQYDLTAQENVGLGDVRHVEDIARVREAAKKAGVHGTLEKLPQSYQTMLSRIFGDDGFGTELSGGEWQKIALARMFMRGDANLIILDEPTAALDAEAERDIYSRSVELMYGRTTLLISHRFSTVRMADAIAVLEDGHITEYGPHEELLSLERTYARLYKMQAERYR